MDYDVRTNELSRAEPYEGVWTTPMRTGGSNDRIDPRVESPPSILDEKGKYASAYYVPEPVGS
jgi:hypothetical protein